MTKQVENLDLGMYVLSNPRLNIPVVGLHVDTQAGVSDMTELMMSAGASLIDIVELEQVPETSTLVRVKFSPTVVEVHMALNNGKMWSVKVEYEEGDRTVDPQIISACKESGGILVALLCGDRKLFAARGYGFRPTGSLIAVFAPIEFI